MFDLKEFNGSVTKVPYVNSFDELQRQILKEIVFYSSGLGWRRQCSNEVEEQCILFPYAEKGEEPSADYIKNFKFLIGAEITYFRNCVTGAFKPIKDFSWDIDVTDNKYFFVLSVFKM